MTDDVAGTLRWINEIRAEHEKPLLDDLPMGRRAIENRCPIARALDFLPYLQVFGTAIRYGDYSWSKRRRIVLPRQAYNFVKDFDKGRYPQYDLRLRQ